jgi:hypothetical protein
MPQAERQGRMIRAAVIALPLLWRKPQQLDPWPVRSGWHRGFVAQLLAGAGNGMHHLRPDRAPGQPMPAAAHMAVRGRRHHGRRYGTAGARNGRRRAAGAVLAAVLLPGCAVSVPADTLCQLPRPRAAMNDTAETRASQAGAAKMWDRQCTVSGWVRSAAK